ncbi:extracellular solute-binding protein [Anaerococcus sp. AGMB00486]|uniref:Extracellular solute-binding protein n=2 Tax=Anaerococcus TaxID=165779 RepID=A0ABX2NA67_9FIRM|nr:MULTISPECIES: extracellular solute-binding protein [Anaerococcus]MSS77729.1 extracellular solute-binding protein [Anaerococcus porci]NVF11584.1 extracellular solute-binding protein [Anaerococcus faecalis]
MKLKKIVGMGILVLSLVFVGCSSNNDTANKASNTKNEDSQNLKNVGKDTIIVYSNAVSDGRGDYFKEKAKEAGFDVEMVDLGGTDLVNRLLAEKNAPVADIVFGLNEMNFKKLAKEDMFEPYKPNWLDQVMDGININEEGLYSPMDMARVFPIYNKEFVKEEDIPNDWSDFYNNEKYKGLYKVQNGLGGATDTAAMYIHLINYKDESKDMGVKEEAWDKLSKWFKNGYQTPEGEDWIQNFVDGKVPYAYTYMAKPSEIEKEYGVKIGIINPKSGVIQTVEQIGIIKDGEDNKKEKEFVDWIGSTDVMAGFAEGYNQMPVNKKAQESAPEGLKRVMEETTPAEIDFDFVGKYIDQWVEYVELNIL